MQNAERLLRLLESMAADLTGKAGELRAEARILRAVLGVKEGDGERGAEA